MPGTIHLKRPRHITVKFIISGDPEQRPRAPREGKGPQTKEREGEWCSLPQEHYRTLEDSEVSRTQMKKDFQPGILYPLKISWREEKRYL